MGERSYRSYTKALHLCEIHLLSGIAAFTLLTLFLLISLPSVGNALEAQYLDATQVDATQVDPINIHPIDPCRIDQGQIIRLEDPQGKVLDTSTSTLLTASNPCHGDEPQTVVETVIDAVADLTTGNFGYALGNMYPISGSIISTVITIPFATKKSDYAFLGFGATAAGAPGEPLPYSSVDIFNIEFLIFDQAKWDAFQLALSNGGTIAQQDLISYASYATSIYKDNCTNEELPGITLDSGLKSSSTQSNKDSEGFDIYKWYPALSSTSPPVVGSSTRLNDTTSLSLKNVSTDVDSDLSLSGKSQTVNASDVTDPVPTSGASVYTPNIVNCNQVTFPETIPAGAYRVIIVVWTNLSQWWNILALHADPQPYTEVSFIQIQNNYYKSLLPFTEHPPIGLDITVYPNN